MCLTRPWLYRRLSQYAVKIISMTSRTENNHHTDKDVRSLPARIYLFSELS